MQHEQVQLTRKTTYISQFTPCNSRIIKQMKHKIMRQWTWLEWGNQDWVETREKGKWGLKELC